MQIDTKFDDGREQHTSIGPAHAYGNTVWSILFNDDADIIGETDSTIYYDYCKPCIVALEYEKMTGEPFPDVESHGCECDPDDDDDDDDDE